MNLNQLMKANVLEPDYVEYQPSKRLVDEDGKPQTWLLRPLTTKEYDRITERNTIKVRNKMGKVVDESMDKEGIANDMVLESLVEPSKEDLQQKELQDSWGVFDPTALLKAMLSLPGEYANLLVKVQEIAGFDVLAVEEAREETEKNS